MKFDEVLIKLGEFGKYQIGIYILLCLPWINSGMYTLMSAFTLGVPDHRCAIPWYKNDSFKVQNEDHQLLINRYIPESFNNQYAYEPCSAFTDDDNNSQSTNDTASCSHWVYDKTDFEETFITQNDLVCKDKMLPSIVKMMLFAGVFVGTLGFGALSDIIGRKKTLMISIVLVLVSLYGLAWAQNILMYAILQFILGAADGGNTSYIIAIEFVAPSKRVQAGMIIMGFFSVGLLALDFVGYFIRQWDYLIMAIAFPYAIYLSYWWLIPESPRWLISQGKIAEAEEIVQKAAKWNKIKLKKNILDQEYVSTGTTRAHGRVWELFRSKALSKRTLVIFFNWLVVSMVYYGLSFNTWNLGGNFYVNFALSGVVEFPAYGLCLLLLDRIGRKRLHCMAMVLGGVFCISTAFTTTFGQESLKELTVVLAMVGKLGAAAAFAIIFIFSSELFPTTVRNAGIGASSCCARIGGMIAPFIADLNKVVSGELGRALPLLIFGSTSVIAGLLALTLPETLNKDLPETMEECKSIGRPVKKQQLIEMGKTKISTHGNTVFETNQRAYHENEDAEAHANNSNCTSISFFKKASRV